MKTNEYNTANVLEDLSAEECEALVYACLKNHWLSSGIKPSKPKDAARHFSIKAAESLEDLRGYFLARPHGVREGVVYRNLAFVQQVDLGDEWLVLRRSFDDELNQSFWIPFESLSLDRAIASAIRFECSIEALQEKDPYDTAVLFGADKTKIEHIAKQHGSSIKR